MKVTIADSAARDIEEILLWSYENFGEIPCQRYERLLIQAISDLSSNPEHPSSKLRPELGQGVRTYHLSLSRERMDLNLGRVRRPRHFLVYRIRSAATSEFPEDHLEIARVLHDSMDIARHEI